MRRAQIKTMPWVKEGDYDLQSSADAQRHTVSVKYLLSCNTASV